jgi:hypothetical protein
MVVPPVYVPAPLIVHVPAPADFRMLIGPVVTAGVSWITPLISPSPAPIRLSPRADVSVFETAPVIVSFPASDSIAYPPPVPVML